MSNKHTLWKCWISFRWLYSINGWKTNAFASHVAKCKQNNAAVWWCTECWNCSEGNLSNRLKEAEWISIKQAMQKNATCVLNAIWNEVNLVVTFTLLLFRPTLCLLVWSCAVHNHNRRHTHNFANKFWTWQRQYIHSFFLSLPSSFLSIIFCHSHFRHYSHLTHKHRITIPSCNVTIGIWFGAVVSGERSS